MASASPSPRRRAASRSAVAMMTSTSRSAAARRLRASSSPSARRRRAIFSRSERIRSKMRPATSAGKSARLMRMSIISTPKLGDSWARSFLTEVSTSSRISVRVLVGFTSELPSSSVMGLPCSSRATSPPMISSRLRSAISARRAALMRWPKTCEAFSCVFNDCRKLCGSLMR